MLTSLHMINAKLSHLSPLLSPASFVVDGYIGLDVPIGTDAFIQHFVKDKCQAIMEDVDKLDNIQDAVAKNTAWTFTVTTPAPALRTQVQPRRMIGWQEC
jgi:hypothetical protein